MPDFDQVDEITAKLTPPLVIVLEMNKERIDSVNQMAEVLANILLPQNADETLEEKRIRMFKEEYNRSNLPTLDWDKIDEIMSKVKTKSIIEQNMNNSNNDMDNFGNNSNQGYGNNEY